MVKSITIIHVPNRRGIHARSFKNTTRIPVSFLRDSYRRRYAERILRAPKLLVVVDSLDDLCKLTSGMKGIVGGDCEDSQGNRLRGKQLIVLCKKNPLSSKLFETMLFRDFALGARCQIVFNKK